jgi:hypothetical protein
VPPATSDSEYFINNTSTSMFFRANLLALDEWASGGRPAPPSRHPLRGDGTLVTYAEWRQQFPAIPATTVPRSPSRLELLDFGPNIDRGIIGNHPPVVIADKEYMVLVPAVDSDGLDIGGLRAPMIQAPLGTYLGWNIRKRALGPGMMHGLKGSYIPFPDTSEERVHTGDPRRSVEERYADASAYVDAIRAAAERLVADRLMLEEDIARAAAQASDWGRPRHAVTLPA